MANDNDKKNGVLKFITNIKVIIASIMTMAAFVSIVLGFNAYFAKADDVKKVDQKAQKNIQDVRQQLYKNTVVFDYKLEHKIIQDEIAAATERKWKLEDRCEARGDACTDFMKEMIRELDMLIKKKEKELEDKKQFMLEQIKLIEIEKDLENVGDKKSE